MELIPIGTTVQILGMTGKISAIAIRGDNHVTYEIMWGDGRQILREWFDRNEFEAFNCGEPLKIGFRQ